MKRLLVHVGGFNLGLFMRTRFGIGTPRSLQGHVALVVALWMHLVELWRNHPPSRILVRIHAHHRFELLSAGP